MNKIKDVFDNIKDRFTNPLIFSFISSWLIINWPITVSLLWYDTRQIDKTGYNSIFEFISHKITFEESLRNPLCFALGYTLIMPIIKNLIRAFYSWAGKWGENWNLRILDEGKISINKYLSLKADHKKRSKILEKVISEESTYLENYSTVNTDLLQTKNNLNESMKQLNTKDEFIRQLDDIRILSGTWENHYQLEDGRSGIETVLIENNRYFMWSPFGIREEKFTINDFSYDNRNGDVFFVKEVTTEQKKSRPKTEHYNINRLRFETKDFLVGTENGTTKIEYRRKKL